MANGKKDLDKKPRFIVFLENLISVSILLWDFYYQFFFTRYDLERIDFVKKVICWYISPFKTVYIIIYVTNHLMLQKIYVIASLIKIINWKIAS